MNELDRFGGIARLYGIEALHSFQTTKVVVVGVGGVGSWAAEALARSGFKHICLIDMDDICVTNTNRQVHTLQSTVGQLKVEALAERLRGINPDIHVKSVMDFVTPDNVQEHLQWGDYILDAIDSVKSKAAILSWCKRNKVPVVTTGAAGGQTDPTKITVADLNKTTNDPLAKKVRSYLRRHYNFSRNSKRTYGISCVYSLEQLKYPQPDGTVCQQKSFTEGAVKMDCASGFGSSTMVTASFGFAAAAIVAERVAKKTKQK